MDELQCPAPFAIALYRTARKTPAVPSPEVTLSALSVPPPLQPMLAKSLADLPNDGDWLFEPKWDGFRALVFRDRGELLIQSRDHKPLNRYFPELEAPLKAQLPERCVVDGEIVDRDGARARLRSAADAPPSRGVAREEARRPDAGVGRAVGRRCASGDENLLATPFRDRRVRLESMLADATPPIHLTPATTDRAVAADWFRRFEGAGLDGVIAKPAGGAYEPNKRVMFKVKHERECDCVVARLSLAQGRATATAVGSLLLGLYDGEGALHHVGVAASFTAAKRRELVELLAPYRASALVARTRGRLGGPANAEGERAAHARRQEPVEPGQGPLVGAAARGARRSGGLRPHAGLAIPPHGAVSPLAG